MQAENAEEKKSTQDVYKIVSLLLFAFALVFLVTVALMEGMGRSYLGVRIILFLIGFTMLISGTLLKIFTSIKH